MKPDRDDFKKWFATRGYLGDQRNALLDAYRAGVNDVERARVGYIANNFSGLLKSMEELQQRLDDVFGKWTP